MTLMDLPIIRLLLLRNIRYGEFPDFALGGFESGCPADGETLMTGRSLQMKYK